MLKCLPALAEGRYLETAGFIDEAQGIYRKIGDREDELSVFIRARLARLTGETVLARKLAEELVNSNKASINVKVWGWVELGHLELQKGDLEQAQAAIRNGLQIFLSDQEMWDTDYLYDALAVLAARQKQVEHAARLFGSRWCRGHAHLLSPAEKSWREADWAAMQSDLGDEQFAKLYEEGKRSRAPS